MKINSVALFTLILLNMHTALTQSLFLKTKNGEELPIDWTSQNQQGQPQDKKTGQLTDKLLKNLINIYRNRSKKSKAAETENLQEPIDQQDIQFQPTDTQNNFQQNLQDLFNQNVPNDKQEIDFDIDVTQDGDTFKDQDTLNDQDFNVFNDSDFNTLNDQDFDVLNDQQNQILDQQSQNLLDNQINVGQQTTFQSQPSRQRPLSQKRNYMLFLTNNLRNRNRVAKLKINQFLNKVAQQHSDDMARNNFFDHTNLRGEGPGERAKRNGYIGPVGQNIAYAVTIDQAQNGFINSPGHFQNAIKSDWEEMGIGIATKGIYYYITCMFMPRNITSTKLAQNELNSLQKKVAVVVKQQNPNLKRQDPKLSAFIQQWIKNGSKGSLLQYVMQKKQKFGNAMYEVILTSSYSNNVVDYFKKTQAFRNKGRNFGNFGIGIQQNQSRIIVHVLFY